DGSRNGSWGWGDAIRISQTGNNNGRTSSVARMKGSDGNGIHVSEVGNGNNFDVRQGVSVSSTGNYATVSQLGNYNDATATQYGDNNSLTVSQNGNYNRSTTLFTGSDNGVGGLTGVAGNLVSVSSDLTQGTVFQDSSTSMHGN